MTSTVVSGVDCASTSGRWVVVSAHNGMAFTIPNTIGDKTTKTAKVPSNSFVLSDRSRAGFRLMMCTIRFFRSAPVTLETQGIGYVAQKFTDLQYALGVDFPFTA